MRILFDNCTPRGVASALPGHTVEEARSQGWDTLRRSDGRGAKILVSTEAGECPVWSRTKNEIYFWSQNRVVGVTVPSDPTSGLGRPVVLFRGDPYRGPGAVAGFDVGPTEEFLMVRTQSGSQSTEIKVVLNWFEELRRLAPRN